MSVHDDYCALAKYVPLHLLPALRRLRDLAEQSHHPFAALNEADKPCGPECLTGAGHAQGCPLYKVAKEVPDGH